MDTLKTLALLLMIPVVGTVFILLMAGKGDGEFDQNVTARIEYPRDQVYEWLSDPAYRVRWIEGLQKCKLDGLEVEVGARMSESVAVDGPPKARTVEVVELEYGRLFVVRIVEAGSSLELRYELSPHQSGKKTLVKASLHGQLEGWWPRLAEPILAARIADQVESDLARLAEELRRA